MTTLDSENTVMYIYILSKNHWRKDKEEEKGVWAWAIRLFELVNTREKVR